MRQQGTGNRKTSEERETRLYGSPFMDPLEIAYSLFMEMGVFWIHGAFRAGEPISDPLHAEGKRKVHRMKIEIDAANALADSRRFALGFMVWVLWNWWREEHHDGRTGASESGVWKRGTTA